MSTKLTEQSDALTKCEKELAALRVKHNVLLDAATAVVNEYKDTGANCIDCLVMDDLETAIRETGGDA